MSATPPRQDALRQAAEAWIQLLATFGGDAAVAARALAPGVVVERYGFGAAAGEVVEVLEGAGRVVRWAGLTNPITEFELTALEIDAAASPPQGVGRYAVRVPGFEGGGLFRFDLDDEGRIAHLAHMPDDLDDALEETRDHERWRHIVDRARRRTGGLAPTATDRSCGLDREHDHHDHAEDP